MSCFNRQTHERQQSLIEVFKRRVFYQLKTLQHKNIQPNNNSFYYYQTIRHMTMRKTNQRKKNTQRNRKKYLSAPFF